MKKMLQNPPPHALIAPMPTKRKTKNQHNVNVPLTRQERKRVEDVAEKLDRKLASAMRVGFFDFADRKFPR